MLVKLLCKHWTQQMLMCFLYGLFLLIPNTGTLNDFRLISKIKSTYKGQEHHFKENNQKNVL